MLVINDADGFKLAEGDMRRWWRHRCIVHRSNGVIYIELADRSATHLRESVKRLASFGVVATVKNVNEITLVGM